MKITMNRLVRALRHDGWRIRDGEWPTTRACQDRWDLVRIRTADSDTLFPLSPEAGTALIRTTEALK
jgi:hypothetical protein